ncbi:hypothetical protein K470DRAFT_278003 [Piedraia hortae CBS 480.64]|uniref:Uncharacterized protein n=1 Tax=Piedraia hortae CBS 480.64 TaxID=1314780 RepID=A0A6A7BW12_9PEZI|nr:hypothetical protein K470DRAFT_278003 [Piedraia hortae CBS 480.64]
MSPPPGNIKSIPSLSGSTNAAIAHWSASDNVFRRLQWDIYRRQTMLSCPRYERSFKIDEEELGKDNAHAQTDATHNVPIAKPSSNHAVTETNGTLNHGDGGRDQQNAMQQELLEAMNTVNDSKPEGGTNVTKAISMTTNDGVNSNQTKQRPAIAQNGPSERSTPILGYHQARSRESDFEQAQEVEFLPDPDTVEAFLSYDTTPLDIPPGESWGDKLVLLGLSLLLVCQWSVRAMVEWAHKVIRGMGVAGVMFWTKDAVRCVGGYVLGSKRELEGENRGSFS